MGKYQEVGQYLELGFFTWPRANAGYYIDNNAEQFRESFTNEGDGTPGPFILETPESTGYIMTRPLDDNPTLFLDFAGIDGSRESMISFANQHGLLTKEIMLDNIPHDTKTVEGYTVKSKFILGDTIDLWQREHFAMKHIVQLWEWLRNRDLEKLNLSIHWYDANRAIRYTLGAEDDLRAYKKDGGIMGADQVWRRPDNNEPLNLIIRELASETYPPGLLSRFMIGSVEIPAQAVIQKVINEKLRKYPTSPMLLMNKDNHLKQYFVPQNLLSAMWFQFFQTVSGERKYKRCEVCNKWDDVTNKRASWSKHPECAARVRTAKYREPEQVERRERERINREGE